MDRFGALGGAAGNSRLSNGVGGLNGQAKQPERVASPSAASGASSQRPGDLVSLLDETRAKLRTLEAAAMVAGVPDPLSSTAAAAAAQLQQQWERHVEVAFERIDTNGDGFLSRAEVIKACRSDALVRQLLGLPQTIRQEDGSRDAFELLFQRLDMDDSKSISFDEFLCIFGRSARSSTRHSSHTPTTPSRHHLPSSSERRQGPTSTASRHLAGRTVGGAPSMAGDMVAEHALSSRTALAVTYADEQPAAGGGASGGPDGQLRGLSHRIAHLAGGWWASHLPDTFTSWWNRQALIESTSGGILPLTDQPDSGPEPPPAFFRPVGGAGASPAAMATAAGSARGSAVPAATWSPRSSYAANSSCAASSPYDLERRTSCRVGGSSSACFSADSGSRGGGAHGSIDVRSPRSPSVHVGDGWGGGACAAAGSALRADTEVVQSPLRRRSFVEGAAEGAATLSGRGTMWPVGHVAGGVQAAGEVSDGPDRLLSIARARAEARRAQAEEEALQAAREAEEACAAAAVAEAMLRQGGGEPTSAEITREMCENERLHAMSARIAQLSRTLRSRSTIADDEMYADDGHGDGSLSERLDGRASAREMGREIGGSESDRMLPESVHEVAALCALENDLIHRDLFNRAGGGSA